MAFIDDFIYLEFKALQEMAGQVNSIGEWRLDATDSQASDRLPMLLRVSAADWKPITAEFQERFRIGTIIACTGSAKTLQDLKDDPRVLAIEASRIVDETDDCAASVPAVKGDIVHRPPTSELGDCALIGIVDRGIDLLHEAFLDGHGNSRILAIWDQRSSATPSPPGFGFGRLYSATEIAGFLANPSLVPAALTSGNEHGTHVASIAAGRRTPHFAGGMAPDAKVVIVIPELSVAPPDPRSIGYSQSHLAALKFLREFAASKKLPIAINMSLGMNAGAHDGKSLLEAGFDAISENGRLPGFVVVKSAGNERTRETHSRLPLVAKTVTRFEWNSSPAVRAQDYIEAWFKACDDLEFQLVAPTRENSACVSRRILSDSGKWTVSGNEYELRLQRFHFDNGDSRLLLRVGRGAAATIAPGKWTLEIRVGTIPAASEVHAWIERDSARGAAFVSNLDPGVTVSIPGTALSAITVASIDHASGVIARSSSFGPTRDGREKPTVCAPGEKIMAAKTGSTNKSIAKSGTSMAAPHVTGAIALLLSRREKRRVHVPTLEQWNASQIQAGIQYTAQGFNGSWSKDKGYGLLDADALLKAFD